MQAAGMIVISPAGQPRISNTLMNIMAGVESTVVMRPALVKQPVSPCNPKPPVMVQIPPGRGSIDARWQVGMAYITQGLMQLIVWAGFSLEASEPGKVGLPAPKLTPVPCIALQIGHWVRSAKKPKGLGRHQKWVSILTPSTN